MTTAARKSFLRALPAALVLLVAIVGFVALRDTLTFETLRDNREELVALRDANYWWMAAVFVAIYASIVALSLPGATVATLTGGFLFSVFPGALFNVVAATVGASALFLAVRMGFGRRIASRLDDSGGKIRRIKEEIDANQWSMLFLIRLLPAVPFFVANLLPALVNVPLYRYVVSTFLGIMPGAIVFTSIGAGLGEVFETGAAPDFGLLFSPPVILPIAGLCLLAVLPVIIRAWRGGKDL